MKKAKISLVLIIFSLLSFNLISIIVTANSDKWYRVWGGNDHDECHAIALDSSENIYIAGLTESFGAGDYDICFVKYDNSGNYQWNKTFGGIGSDLGLALTIDSSDNIFLAGNVYNVSTGSYDIVLIKYDSLGNYQWNRTWDGGEDDICFAISLDSSENIYLAGMSESLGPINQDFCLVKYDNSGNYQWNRTWGGVENDQCKSLVLDSADNIYLAGDSESFGMGQKDFCLVKYNSSGDYQWNRTWGGTSEDFCEAIVLESSGNIVITGTTYSFGSGYSDIALIKYNSLGEYQWNRTWGGTSYDYCNSITVDSSENIYLGGTTGVHYCIIVYNTQGSFQWYKSLKVYDGGSIRGMILDSSESIYLAGTVFSSVETEHDFLLIKNLHLFEDQQINGYDIILLTSIMIMTFVIFIKLKFKFKTKF